MIAEPDHGRSGEPTRARQAGPNLSPSGDPLRAGELQMEHLENGLGRGATTPPEGLADGLMPADYVASGRVDCCSPDSRARRLSMGVSLCRLPCLLPLARGRIRGGETWRWVLTGEHWLVGWSPSRKPERCSLLPTCVGSLVLLSARWVSTWTICSQRPQLEVGALRALCFNVPGPSLARTVPT